MGCSSILYALRAATVLAVALGSFGAEAQFPNAARAPVQGGKLLEPPATLRTLVTTAIDARTEPALRPLTGRARCDVRVVALNYRTRGVWGEASNASAALLVPSGACAQDEHPLIAYGKATDVEKLRTLANPADPETFELIAMFAAHGYAVVASDYLGFARSSYAFHPFLHAESEATTLVDAIRAARQAMEAQGEIAPSLVLLAGYSQGGHASAAAQRLIEQQPNDAFDVVGAAHLAAPLNLSGAMQLEEPIVAYQFFTPYLLTSWQKIYGNLYQEPIEAFRLPYARTIESLLPNPTLGFQTLLTTGALPDGSPAHARRALMQRDYVIAVRNQPGHPARRSAKRNDMLDWDPRAPTLLCAGSGDPVIPPAVHQAVALASFARRGATSVTAVDVDPQVQATFGPGGVAPPAPGSDGYVTYYANYHSTYARPFCDAQARAHFNRLLEIGTQATLK
ncbi:alpha/beta fold hydrolase [Ramlibacter monticola]|uniref:Alpha/beta hydrolase n=1 Tax=Ramlibacter monticola TaxID=1926872 RepID=A0A936YUT5_9BURK|nr:lipase family protein [Ramlibacter monticola]MBL0389571.1 alpha/beta hydrolase [Ramlibacter monticola]